ncbi:MAG: hypothetical protein KBS38_05020 [Bacteroidales bacterium]|nr:hypothetical protein [Candidatus Cacconaster caballi]
MKKTVVSIAALLSCCLAFSQEANDAGLSGDLLIVPRLEYSPCVYTGDGYFESDFGDSGLSTLFEGDLGDHVSFSVANLWLNKEPGLLYKESFSPIPTLYTWVNWAYVDIHYNNFFTVLGKQAIKIATFEEDEYDFNSYSALSSFVWNYFPLYQWGGCIGWRSDDQESEAGLQINSGFSGRWPFQKGITASAYYLTPIGEKTNARVSLTYFHNEDILDIAENNKYFMLAGGLQREFGDATVTVDAYFYNKYSTFNTSIIGSLKYDFEQFDVTARACFNNYGMAEITNTSFKVGGVLQYYPIRNCEDLRLHLAASYYPVPTMPEVSAVNFSAGVTYFLNLKLF